MQNIDNNVLRMMKEPTGSKVFASKFTAIIAVLFIPNFANTVCGKVYTQCRVTMDISQCVSSSHSVNSNRSRAQNTCHNGPICGRNFVISKFGKNVYGVELVEQILHTCCGSCTKTSTKKGIQRMSQLSSLMNGNVDFVFPILGKVDQRSLHGYYYIPLIKAPKVYYISHANHHVMFDVLLSCLSLWPLLLVTALMVLISGFICWLMETWDNKKEFPRNFVVGWFEGIWWSFISMTTVGYGDKAPKSVSARIFSIIWIIIGIATFSLITASLTSVIVAINSSPPPTMEGANVGVLQHHLHESIIVADQGGIAVDVHFSNMTDGIHRMVNMLHGHKIDGFLLDRYALVLFYTFFSNHPKYGQDVSYIRNYGLLSEVNKIGDGYMHGILVKKRQDFYFLNEFVQSNREVIDSCNRLFLNTHSRNARLKHEPDPLFTTNGKMFWLTIYSLGTVVVVIIVIGFAHELGKGSKYLRKKRKSAVVGKFI